MTARPTTKTWIRDRPLITSSQKDPRINPWVGCSTCTNKEPYKSTRNHEQSETSWYLLTQSKLCHILNQISQGLKLSLHFSCRQHNSMVSEVLHQFLKDMYVRMPHGTVIQSAKVRQARWQIHSLPSLRELLLGIGVGHRRWNNYSFTLLPVGWCSNAVSSRQLKRIQNTNNLVEVTTSCAWVKEAQFQPPKKTTKSRVSFKLPIIAYSWHSNTKHTYIY